MPEGFTDRLRRQLMEGRPAYRRRRRQWEAVAAVIVLTGGGGLLAWGLDSDPATRVVTEPGPTATDPSRPPTSTTAPTTTAPTTTAPTTTLPPRLEPVPDIGPERATKARRLVRGFLAAVRRGDLSAASDRWSGYPSTLEGDTTAKIAALEDFQGRYGWLVDASSVEMLVTPSWSFAEPDPVVTVAAPGQPGRAAAFLVGTGDQMFGDGGPLILRIPTIGTVTGTPPQPPPGGTVAPGGAITVPGVPLEGGAVAHIGGTQVPVQTDLREGELRITVPEEATGRVVLTVSVASPELPSADAFAYLVG